MKDLYAVTPELGEQPHIFRQTKFDITTFDRFQTIKRRLSAYWCGPLTNAEVLKAIILSHPAVSPE